MQIETEPQRMEMMVEMAVDVRPLTQGLPDGNAAGHGESTIRVYKSSVPQVMQLIETEPEKIAQAEEHYKAEIAEFMKVQGCGKEEAEGRNGGSVPASFRTLFHRDIMPLVSAKVLKEDIPPPAAVKQHNANAALIKDIMEQVGPMLSKGIADGVKEAMGKGRR